MMHLTGLGVWTIISVAQGILDKPDGGHRIIHDGTHGEQLNNEINITDRLENPGPRELAAIMNIVGGGW